MPEGLTTPDGAAIDLDAAERQFAASMSAPPSGDEHAPPKRATPDEPKPEAKPRRGRPPKAARKPAEAAKPVTAEVHAKRVQDTTETVQMLAGVTLLAGKGLDNTGLRADAYVLSAAAPQWGAAAAEVAKHDPAFARLIDRSASGKMVAYMGLFGVAASTFAQVAVNHKLIRPGLMGTADPDDIVRSYESGQTPAEGADEQQAG